MLSWWFEDPRVPEFITHCKDVQWKDRQAGLAILDAWLIAVASRVHLAEKSFPDERPNFEGLPRLDRTWGKWKSHFQDSQEALKRVIQYSDPSVDSFGSANTAASIHRISHNWDTVQAAAYRSRAQGPPPGAIPSDEFIDSFSGLMDNMASSATNNKLF